MIWAELSERQKDKDTFADLSKLIAPNESTTPQSDEATEESLETPADEPPQRSLVPLFEQNSDCIGWISIPGTVIDYPVMHTPSNSQKYLHRNFYGEYSSSGVPFLDGRCATDGDVLLIYGHNMKNGTMFSALKGYLDSTYLSEHPSIEFEMADGCRCYTVVEVKITDTLDEWYSLVNADVEQGDSFLVLSTCYGSSRDGRLLVIAVEN